MGTPSLGQDRWLALLPVLRHPPAHPMSAGLFGQDDQRPRAEAQSLVVVTGPQTEPNVSRDAASDAPPRLTQPERDPSERNASDDRQRGTEGLGMQTAGCGVCPNLHSVQFSVYPQ
jgi:hypothetical protein